MTPPSRRTRRIVMASVVALATAATGLAISLNSSASAAVTGQISGMDGKCIGPAGGKTDNSTPIDIYSCVGDATQQWTFPGDGTIRTAGKCMDVSQGGTSDGTAVQLYTCNGTAAQQWVYSSARDLVNPQANKCLDMKGISSADFNIVHLWTCTGKANQKWNVPSGNVNPPPNNSGFVVSEAQFNQMFPGRNGFYTYRGLTDALSAYSAFAKTGSDTVRKQEAAAFLANVNHETGGLVHIVEQNTANYSHYCDPNQPYGCPAGQSAYYGRGPVQLSWNFNYKAAGDALGIDLLRNPNLVQNDPAVAWKTGIWYWMTQNGPGSMTPHNAMVNGAGFGQTIRSINGALECDGRNPAQVQSRVDSYKRFTGLLGVTPGNNLTC